MKWVFISLVFLNSSSVAQITYPEKGWIQQLQRYTISLGDVQHDTVTSKGARKIYLYYNILGTGAVFYINFDNSPLAVVVTAKHVLKDLKNNFLDSIRMRLSSRDGESVYKYLGVNVPLTLDGQSMIFAHPDSTVDLACFPLISKDPYTNRDSVSLIPYSFFPEDYQIFEGAEIYVLGYPGSVGRTYWTRALLRKSIIAWTAANAPTKKFLIDCQVYPGNSGGPVFTKIPNFPIMMDTTDYSKMYKFVGIVIERRFTYNKLRAYRDGAFSPVSDADSLRYFSAESIGVGVVEPARNVFDMLKAYEAALARTDSSNKEK